MAPITVQFPSSSSGARNYIRLLEQCLTIFYVGQSYEYRLEEQLGHCLRISSWPLYRRGERQALWHAYGPWRREARAHRLLGLLQRSS